MSSNNDNVVSCTIAEDDEGCTVIYPPLKWPAGSLVTLHLVEDSIPYRLTEAGRAMLRDAQQEVE